MENTHLHDHENRLGATVLVLILFGLIVLVSYLQWTGKL
jgi:hypothetical protein